MAQWSVTLILLKLLLACFLYSQVNSRLISRSEWGARRPTQSYNLRTPVSLVIVHHTDDSSGPCWSSRWCKARVKGYQDRDMDDGGYTDIAYNFYIGYDGNSYEGRGWNKIGYHSGSDNKRSIGIAFIGDFNSRTPSSSSLNVLKELIKEGVEEGAIASGCQLEARSGRRLSSAVRDLGGCAGILGNSGNTEDSDESPGDSRLTIISRSSWGARKYKSSTRLEPERPMVVIHHTESGSCSSLYECKRKVKGFQNYHMDDRGWSDIGYNFLIGGDGRTYEGRGWYRMGAHAKGYNSRSIGIAFIGSFTNTRPNAAAVGQAKALIAEGVRKGRISRNYSLKGHRDVGSTSCPGNSLYQMVKRRFSK